MDLYNGKYYQPNYVKIKTMPLMTNICLEIYLSNNKIKGELRIPLHYFLKIR